MIARLKVSAVLARLKVRARVLSGLFERHKLLFSFQMTIKIMEADGKLRQDELDFFLKGNIALEKSARTKPYGWLPDQGWEDLLRLVTVTPDAFGSLADDVERNENAWKEVGLPSSNPFTPKFKNYIVPTFLKRNVWVR